MKNKPDGGGSILAGRIKDLVASSEYTVRTSQFLSPSEQKEAFDAARDTGGAQRCFFWGGALDAERRAAVFLPDWMTPEDVTFGGAFDPAREEALCELIASGADGGEINSAITSLEIDGSAYADLSHRDYLGALTSLGIERCAIGDISPDGPSRATVFALGAAASLILSELSTVGRESVRVSKTSLPCNYRISREYEAISETVASPRLDGIVKALCGISREASAEAVARGDVQINYTVVTKPDEYVEKGDVLTVRGYGKFIYDGDRGVNRRGRLRIDARKYK